MRVLLIGGHGFIGRRLADRLLQGGDELLTVGRGQDFEPLLGEVDAVVHLACETTPGISQHIPTRELGNISLGLRLAEVLLKHPKISLLFVSSGGTVYGNSVLSPVPETAPLVPLSFHGAGKAALEMFFGVLRNQGRTVINVRPANAYGPGQPLKGGFGFIRTVLEHARSGGEMLVWGDGEVVRDFVYVSDVAQAIACLLAKGESGSFNVGSSEGYSLNQVLQLAREVTGCEIPVRYEGGRGGDVKRNILDISKLTATVNWQPEISLEEGLRRTWEVL